MFLTHNSPVRIVTSGHDVTYFLPARPIGKLRCIGLFPILFSLCVTSVPAKSLFEIFNRTIETQGKGGHWIMALMLCWMIVLGLTPMGLGILVLAGRCRIDWNGAELKITDYFGPILWRRRLPKSPILKFLLNAPNSKGTPQTATSSAIPNFAVLLAEFEQGGSRMITVGYPYDWLQEIAQDLSPRIGISSNAGATPEIKIVTGDPSPQESKEVTIQPANSQVQMEVHPNGVRFVLPPPGIRKGGTGLSFGIIWCLFIGVMSAVISNKDKYGNDTSLVAYVVIGVFWLVGLSIVANAIHTGRRRGMMLIENGHLQMTQAGLFGTKRGAWSREDIACIRADTNGVKINDVPVIELQVLLSTGQKIAFFAGRDKQELCWLATELRRVLNVPATNQ